MLAMTIAHDSKSYPYLALSRSLGVDYGRVLAISDLIDKLHAVGSISLSPTEWDNVHATRANDTTLWNAVRERREFEMRNREERAS
jgi:hypothetical protein